MFISSEVAVKELSNSTMKSVYTSPISRHLEYLDGLRGLAITFLLIGHFFPIPGINFGAVGVNLFFVLSGYLMGQLLFIKETPIPIFYRRRISRIVPAHAFFILCLTILFFETGKPINWSEVFAALGFVNNYFPGELGNAVMPFGHIWSLSVEEHSYILLSIVAIASRKQWLNAKSTIVGLSVFFSAVGFWNFYHYSGRELYGNDLHTEVMAFGIFVSASFLLILHKVRVPKLPAYLYVFLFGAGIMMHWWSIPVPLSRTVGVGLLALAVNLLYVASDRVKKWLSLKPLKMLGLWSFSIYLWQQPFYLAVHRTGVSNILGVSLAVCCGIASFYLLERPVRSYLNRVWGSLENEQGTITKRPIY